jgi:hypothetical protein
MGQSATLRTIAMGWHITRPDYVKRDLRSRINQIGNEYQLFGLPQEPHFAISFSFRRSFSS